MLQGTASRDRGVDESGKKLMEQRPEKVGGERIKGLDGGIGLKLEEREEARSHFLSKKKLKITVDRDKRRQGREEYVLRSLSSLCSLSSEREKVVRKTTSEKNCRVEELPWKQEDALMNGT